MLNLVGAVVVLAIIEPYLLLPNFVIVCIFYALRFVYIKTSRSVKRLEGICIILGFLNVSSTNELFQVEVQYLPISMLLQRVFPLLGVMMPSNNLLRNLISYKIYIAVHGLCFYIRQEPLVFGWIWFARCILGQ